MNMTDGINAYKHQQVATAPPEELTLMLYNGAIKFINESILALDNKDFPLVNKSCVKAQDIITEFMLTLDMTYDISKNYYDLYEYIHYRLVSGNIKKDKVQLKEACSLVCQLRDAWSAAIKISRQTRAATV